MTPIKVKLVYRVNARGQITFGRGRRAYVRHAVPVKSRAIRVTPKGRAYLAALALENGIFEDADNG